ncbi:hypothetical protein RRG08_024947 [Elysia crispata]|uniref:Hexosyltransferase n=1 Tax=Elysia crispata TaxID=231223 RepID=A0AAE1D9F1_9GAST|nr:hypothetical protein RRG08_024947 [Elysia crispata]
MYRLPRPKLVAEFAIFFLFATALIQIALYLTTCGYSVYQISAPKPSLMVEISDNAKLYETRTAVDEKIEVNSLSGDVVAADAHETSTTQLKAKRNYTLSSSGLHERKRNLSINIDQTIANNDPLQNISKPYFSIIKDVKFEINRTYFRPRPKRMSSIPSSFPISSGTVCRPDSPDILFVIPSVATSQAAIERLEIRKTWASGLYGPTWRQTSSARLAFFFGSSGLNAKKMLVLREESLRYGDIVTGDFHDSYQNLSLKMVTIVTWVARHCPSVKAAIKIDMDTYVNVKLLLSLIDQLPKTHSNYVFGHMHAWQNPSVVRSGGWAVPESLYPFNKFPRYIYGHSYVISGPAIKAMSDLFPSFPIVPNEDAFITGIVTNVLNITRFHHDSFAYLLEKRTLCDMIRGVHVTAVMKKENRIKLWDAFNNGTCLKDIL